MQTTDGVRDPDALTIISVDDHLVEPPDMFEGRPPERFADRAPKVIENGAGREMWLFEGVEIPNFGLNAVSGRPQEEYGIEPTRFDEIDCTVGALRALAGHVDVGPSEPRRAFVPPERPLTLLDMLTRAAHPLLDSQREAEGPADPA